MNCNFDRTKGSWLEISLYTTRSSDAEGVHTEPFSHEEGVNKAMHNQGKLNYKPRLSLGQKYPSAFFFKPGYDGLLP